MAARRLVSLPCDVMKRLGTSLIVVGVLALLYGAAVFFWRDPVTDLYSRYRQHQLAAQLDQLFAVERQTATTTLPEPGAQVAAASDRPRPPETVARLPNTVRRAAQSFYAGLELGQPLGRLTIPRLDINPVLVNGTRWGADLSRGPGRYPETAVPGLDRVTAIAGHRTTFGAPFRHIDTLRSGDEIVLKMPYGTFRYTVFEHRIVANDDWSIIRERGFDTVVLSACHPLWSAAQRWVVFARLIAVRTPDGQRLLLAGTGTDAASDRT